MKPQNPKLKGPAISEESSDTEYTSSSEETVLQELGSCVQSQRPDQPAQPPRQNLELSNQFHTSKSEDAVISKQGSSIRFLPPSGVVLNGQPSRCSTLSIDRVVVKPAWKELHEKDANGRTLVVYELDDSDEETDTRLNEVPPLCSKCHILQHKQHEPQVTKAAENKEVDTSKVALVVDLSATASQVNHARVTAGGIVMLGKDGMSLHEEIPVSSKAHRKEVEAKVEARREHIKTISSKPHGKGVDKDVGFNREHVKSIYFPKANGKQVLANVEASREHIKKISSKPHGKQVEDVEFSSEHVKVSFPPKVNGKKINDLTKEYIKIVTKSSQKPSSGSGNSPEAPSAPIGEVRAPALLAAEESEDEASTLSDDYMRSHREGHHAEEILPDWSPGVLCDMCEKGPSLSLGAWYSWCCGNPSLDCSCSSDDLTKKRKQLSWKGGKNWKNNDPPYPWSGRVHKLCGLWSAEVFEDSQNPWRLKNLWEAIQRSKKSKCSDPDCGLFGATLGCRVVSCKKNFHYPCADRQSASVKVRMWDGVVKPIACKDHMNVDDVLDDVKSVKENKKRKRGKKGSSAALAAGPPRLEARTSGGAEVIQIESSDEDSPRGATAEDVVRQWNSPNVPTPKVTYLATVNGSNSWPTPLNSKPTYLGKRLLCADFSMGREPIGVPCTNDVDEDPPPYLEYMTMSRYKGQPVGSDPSAHPLFGRQAKACEGCTLHDPDDPSAPLSVHIPFQTRKDDFREDWLKERMYGRLPYDKYARLVVGTDYNELVECNKRCKCGPSCINREMQKGLRTPIELYKTVNKGWAVRTLVPISRGRFVIEYVGEMLSQEQAQSFGQVYDEIKRSYLYDLDYPESKRTPVFTLDGFHASNVARFINHSCDANLKIYRVYVETTYKWLSHIGMYAMRDIQAGEELSYDYNYGRHELQAHDGNSNSHNAGKQSLEAGHGNDSTHIKCYCGAKNCREWLWRPMHTGDDSEDD